MFNKPNLKIEANNLLTETFVKKLECYMQKNVLADNKFICAYRRECKKSHSGIFYEGQLHHVGKNYDLKINDKPFRIMVVGQEYGHDPKKVSLNNRYQMIMGCKEIPFNDRNPHMRGTTSVLRCLFGKGLGIDCESEWINFFNGGKCHIFDAFVLVNYLLCSALKEGQGMAGKSSSTMKKNCHDHFQKTIEILEPNVIIIQGKGIWNWIRDTFDNIEPVQRSKIIYQAKLNNISVIVVSFTHPSDRNIKYNWGLNDNTPYLNKTVKPTITKIQKIMGIIK